MANILADMRLDVVTLAAGLLHDVVEDTLTTIERIEELFGPEVAHLVEGVTKISAITFSSSEERQAENFRKMLLAMVDDIRVILVKLADRLHNMRTLHHLPEEQAAAIAQETLDIYAPIANRLGMARSRTSSRSWPSGTSSPRRTRRCGQGRARSAGPPKGMIEELKRTITAKLREAQVPVVQIDGRIKRLYSIHQKLKRQKIDLDQVYDFVALRIVTKAVKDCYAALGIIHQTWSPVPGRIKDFIAMPRPNGYQSLHTSVVSEQRLPLRGADPHRGDAPRSPRRASRRTGSTRRGASGRSATSRTSSGCASCSSGSRRSAIPQEFIQNLKVDLYPEEVYIFTPKGRGEGAAARRHADRLRLRRPHRRRPPVRRRPGQRQDGAAADRASRTATSSRSSPPRSTSRAATGSTSWSRRARATRSGTSSRPRRRRAASSSGASCSRRRCAGST